eukprot:TRINITY_DN11035_c0_g1_i1.p1 TRINITY_DN11035_c0_g1~~TRINITY_DN11035_c0_g1_i1.p1  ORF type:complete len:367 (-),score=71.45 TRINITY_DN11035_c0_g1_i1:31-1092(-)
MKSDKVLLCVFVVFFYFVSSSLGAKLIFEDDFKSFNLATWKHEITLGGGGNWEFEYYTNNRSNSFVRNGTLYLKPTLTAGTYGEANVQNGFTLDLWGTQPADLCTGNAFYGCSRMSGAGGNVLNPIQSARIRTAESFNFKYGTLEIRAKLPRGDWIWPAIWLLPTHNSYGDWPASGEIDLVESRGNSPSYSAGGVNQFGSTLHWGPFFGSDQYLLTHQTKTLPSGDFSQNFHVFGFIWNETSMITYLDSPNNIILSVSTKESFWSKGKWGSQINNPWEGRGSNAPFDQEFYVVMNVAVGGTNGYFPDGVGGKPWTDASPHASNEFYAAKNQWLPTWKGDECALQVDWIRVYSQ